MLRVTLPSTSNLAICVQINYDFITVSIFTKWQRYRQVFTKCDAPYKPTVYFYGLALIEIGFFVLRDKLFRNVPFVVYNSHNFAGCKPRSDQRWAFSSLRRPEMDGIQDFQRMFPNRLTLIPRSLVSIPSSQLRATAIKNSIYWLCGLK